MNSLVAAGELGPARELWSETAGGDRQSALVWNGGFESAPLKDFAQFDWSFGRSEYARFAIDAAVAHSGSRSLRIEFVGRDTTQLDNESGTWYGAARSAYRLSATRSDELANRSSARVVVIALRRPGFLLPTSRSAQAIGSASGRFCRAAKRESGQLLSRIDKTQPHSLHEPTRGTVWFDDFSLKEQ